MYVMHITSEHAGLGYVIRISLHLSFLIPVTSFSLRSSVVRAFAHGAMGRRIDPSWGGPTGVTRPWYVLSCLRDMLLIGKSSPYGGSGFPLSLSESFFTICPTPYNRK